LLDKTFLITRPKHESTTSYLYYWTVPVLQFAESRVAKVINVEGEKVNRKEFDGRLKKLNPDFVHLNGHGGADYVMGHNNEIILDAGNVKHLKGKMVYALSCSSGSHLGPLAVTQGAEAYIGYKEEFIFFTENSKYSHPTADETAKLFLHPAMKISESLLKGKTVAEAVKDGREAFGISMFAAASSEVQKGYSAYLPYL
jgi:hypothetical protein